MSKRLLIILVLIGSFALAASAEARWRRRMPVRRAIAAVVRARPLRRVVTAPFRLIVRRRRMVRGYSNQRQYSCMAPAQAQVHYEQMQPRVEYVDPSEPVYVEPQRFQIYVQPPSCPDGRCSLPRYYAY